jgi:hypothetical protein
MLISVDGGQLPEGDPLVMVESIEDLARYAEHCGRVILHKQYGLRNFYFVQDGKTLYLYRIKNSKEQKSMEELRGAASSEDEHSSVEALAEANRTIGIGSRKRRGASPAQFPSYPTGKPLARPRD